MINVIDLKSAVDNAYVNRYGKPLMLLSDIKHINVFVGSNNSGKSRFMRSLIKSKDAVFLTNDKSNKNLVDSARNRLHYILQKLKEADPSIEPPFGPDGMTPTELYVLYKDYFDSFDFSQRSFAYPNNNVRSEVENVLGSLYRSICVTPEDRKDNFLNSAVKIYIPVLRGIENFNMYFGNKRNSVIDSIQMNEDQRVALNAYKANAGRIYRNKVSSVYGIEDKCIFTGENLYEEIRDKLLGEETDRLFIRDFECFISINFYNGEGFTISPLINKGYVNVKIGSSEDRPLHDLGDGIKQIICILYKVFEHKGKEAFFFIEEPEICMHPGYQRKLIEILQGADFSKQYFFLTTHSNHFVDSCFDYGNVSIYKFINMNGENNSFRVINSSPRDIDLLNLLGVNNSSVFMSNCTIWIEGISDKIYISAYLKAYMESIEGKSFQEGTDYSFVEYGGNNIAHWTFAEETDIALIRSSGITNRAYMIVDNDNGRKKNRKDKLQRTFGDSFFELTVREIENTIKKEVLERALFAEKPVYKEGMESAKDRYDTKSAYIWEFIDKHYTLDKKYWNPQRKEPRISKADFAKKICSQIHSVDDLSKSALDLCERIYGFIKRTNESING